ncbi:MAG: TonB family protein [Bdellovibrionales bacterium]|nr:TonB family protein [Bdellovibrionales bacterium]
MKSFEAPKFNHPGFNFFLRRSTYVHILLIVSMMVGGKVAFNIQQRERDKNLELIQASVRVDMVAMPKYTINELKNLSSGAEEAKKEEKAPEVTKDVVKEEPKIEPKETKEEPKIVDTKPDPGPTFEETQAKKRQEFLSKLKSISNKKVDSKGSEKVEKGANGEKESALKDLVLSGNKLSKGTQIYGDGGGANLTAFQAYAAQLPDRVRPRWRLPEFLLKDKSLKARVRIWLDKTGKVTRATVHQSSNNNDFDQRALDAVNSATFPAPGADFLQKAEDGEILLGFPL